MEKQSGFKNLTESEVKRLRWWVRIFVVLTIVGGILAALSGIYDRFNPGPYFIQAQKIVKDPMSITRHVRINGVDLWIPVAYFKPPHIPAEVPQKDILLITLYPDFQPLKERPQEIRERGEWHRKVMILVGDPTGRKNARDLYSSQARAYDATEMRGTEYGLRYYSQPEGVKNGRDIWIEGEPISPGSLILCGKSYSDTDHPQCTHYVWDSGLWYNISFDKKLLPHWREVKDKTLTLTQAFMRNPAPQSTPSINTGD